MTENPLLVQTRRHFFGRCGIGVGTMALASLLNDRRAEAAASPFASPLAPKQAHYAPRAKSVIFLFMAGGPSQLETFDFKPTLQKLDGQPIPDSFIKNKRFAFMDDFTRQVP